MWEALVAFVRHPDGSALLYHLLIAWPLWRIFRRVGLAPWPSLLVFIPIAGMPLVLAALVIQRWRMPPASMQP